MEIQYHRNLKSSYMVVIEESEMLNMDGLLAEKMLCGQKVDGLLRFVTMEHEGKMTFWYNITGMQSLSDKISLDKLDVKLIKKVFGVLRSLTERLPRFYLREEHIVMNLEQVFVDMTGDEVMFCYQPLFERSMGEQVNEFLEKMISLIDHNDKTAVKFGYELYEASRKKNESIWKIYEKLMNEEVVPVYDEEVSTPPKSRDYKKLERLDSKPIVAEPVTYSAGGGFLDKLKSFFVDDIFAKDTVPVKIEKRDVEVEEVTIKDEECQKFMTEDIGEEGQIAGCFKYDGNNRLEDMYVDRDSFLIGCNNPKARGQIKAPSVSRNHARVTREDGKYYIEDLNSRNGTFINGEMVPYRQRLLLSTGDTVKFATEVFRFY